MDNDAVLIEEVSNIVRHYEGVSRLAVGIADNFSMNFLGKDPDTVGIKINDSDKGLDISIHIIVKYGVNIPQLSYDLQATIKKQLKNLIDDEINTVDIHVEGVEK